jgi:hypothetical protein
MLCMMYVLSTVHFLNYLLSKLTHILLHFPLSCFLAKITAFQKLALLLSLGKIIKLNHWIGPGLRLALSSRPNKLGFIIMFQKLTLLPSSGNILPDDGSGVSF